MTRWKGLALFVIFAASIPAASLSVGTASGGAGQLVNLNVVLQTQGAQIAGLQFDLSYDKASLAVDATEGAAANAAHKSASTSSQPTGIRVLIVGLNQTLIADGSVATLAISIAANAPSGSYPITISGAGGTDASGQSVAIAASSGTVSVGGIQAAPPVIFQGGIGPIYSKSTTVQAGSWISIYGTNLAVSSANWNNEFPIKLGDVSVTVNGTPGYLWFVSPGQINLQVPDDATTGDVNVVVTTPNGSFTSTVTLAAASPSLSLLDAKHVAALAYNADGTYDIAGPAGAFPYPTRPTASGEALVLYGVGFGPTDPPLKSGKLVTAAAATVNKVKVTIGGADAPVAYSGIVQAGLYQINVTVPAGIPSGDQPVVASVNGLQTGAGAVVTIR